jgi:hypothetical protein
MAIGLIGVIFLVIGAFGFYTFVFTPLQKAKQTALVLENETKESQRKLFDAMEKEKVLKQDRLKSLPLDPSGETSLARREYEMQLNGLMRQSRFSPTAYSIKMLPTDSKSVPTFPGVGAAKKPIYSKLVCRVQARGTLDSLVSFLWYFYRQPLLHQVKSMSVERARSNTGGSTGRRAATERREVEINIELEAIILDIAEQRPTLSPVTPQAAIVLGGAASFKLGMLALETGRGSAFASAANFSTEKREYSQIGWKDLFYGSIKEEPKPEKGPPGLDYSPYVKLTSVSGDDSGIAKASFFDLANKYEYEVEISAEGKVTCESFYYTGDRRKRLGENYHRFEVLAVDIENRDIYLRWADDAAVKNQAAAGALFGGLATINLPGQVYRMKPGQKISEAEELLSRRARELIYNLAAQGAPSTQPVKSRTRPGL